jgi:hypothetical protein
MPRTLRKDVRAPDEVPFDPPVGATAMTEGIHTEVDTSTGHLRLLCNQFQFNRLSTWLRQEAEIKNLVTVPATEIRVVSVELVTEDETPPGTGKQLASYGCAIAMGLAVISSMVGLWTMAQWVLR